MSQFMPESILPRTLEQIENIVSDSENYDADEAWEAYSSQPVLPYRPGVDGVLEYDEYYRNRANLCKAVLDILAKEICDEFIDHDSLLDSVNKVLSGTEIGEFQLENLYRYAEVFEEYSLILFSEEVVQSGHVAQTMTSQSIEHLSLEMMSDVEKELITLHKYVPRAIREACMYYQIEHCIEGQYSDGSFTPETLTAFEHFIKLATRNLLESQRVVESVSVDFESAKTNRNNISTTIDSVSGALRAFRNKLPAQIIGAVHEFEWLAGAILAGRLPDMPQFNVRQAQTREDYAMHGKPMIKSNTDVFVGLSFMPQHDSFGDATIPVQLKSSNRQKSDQYDKRIYFVNEDRALFQVSRIKKRLMQISDLISRDDISCEQIQDVLLPSVVSFIDDEVYTRVDKVKRSIKIATQTAMKSVLVGESVALPHPLIIDHNMLKNRDHRFKFEA